MRYAVRLMRVISHEATVVIDAPSEAAAKYSALEQAKSLCWPIRNLAEYDVLTIKELKDKEDVTETQPLQQGPDVTA